MMNKKRNLGVLALGATIGGCLGVLFAPKKGSETRETLKSKVKNLKEKAKEKDKENIKDEFNIKVKEIEEELKELDKEKILKIAKEKADKITSKVDDLLDLAIDKGNDVLEKTAGELKEKAISATKKVLEKL